MGALSKLGDWLDERTGHRQALRHVLDEPVPGGARLAYVFGSALTLTLVLQAVTGVLLMTAYAPSAQTAWASVHYVSFQMTAGWVLRGLHHFGAQAMVVLLGLHLAQVALFGAYKRPREINWYLGLALLGLTLGFALTGYLLPWDQKGYWATRVATNIAGTTPVLGGFLQRLLVGGDAYGHLTLTRFYALHVAVLPALTFALLGAHVALFRKHGVTPGARADRSKVDAFFPKQVALDLLAALAVLGVVLTLTWAFRGAPLDAPADPASDYPARPEWYFLPLFEALKYFPGALEVVGAMGVPALVFGYLFALPFVDRSPGTALGPRLKYLAPLAAFALAGAWLTAKSLRNDFSDPAFLASRKAAAERAERAIALAMTGVPPEGPLAMMRNDPESRGPELFAKACGGCHRLGELGPAKLEDVAAPTLTGFGTKAWVKGLLETPDAPEYFGKTPFKGMMPSFTRPPEDPEAAKFFSPMRAEDVDAIAAFLEAEAGGAGRGKGTPGEAQVVQRCTSCHRLDGKTDDEESLAPELRGWASFEWVEAQIRNPGSGKTYPPAAMAADLKGHMPAFEDSLPESDIRLLTQWLIGRRAAP